MPQTSQLLYSVKEIFSTFLENATGFSTYTIPTYQRGYKWKPEDIKRLLDDVNEFVPNDDIDAFYCLQNITLVEAKRKDGHENTYHVVDGQQRLTTLMVILSYLGERELITGKLAYDVREKTKCFIEENLWNPWTLSDKTWDEFAENGEYDYQDIYYLFSAYRAVQDWFEKEGNPKQNFKETLLNHVKLIVNLPKNVEETQLFENLNGKRVALDGADLARAIIITRVAKQECETMDEGVKRSVMLNEKRMRIGMMLDSIGRWWDDKDRQAYFRLFAKEAKCQGIVAFDDKAHPINLLYLLYAATRKDKKLSLDLFEKVSQSPSFLAELIELQSTVEHWYNDKQLYHWIQYAGRYCSIPFSELYKKWKESASSQSFLNDTLLSNIEQIDAIQNILKEIAEEASEEAKKAEEAQDNESEKEVRTEIIGEDTVAKEDKGKEAPKDKKAEVDKIKEAHAFKENYYTNGDLVPICVLLDIIKILSSEKYSKLPVSYFGVNKKVGEDLEHIFPQTPIDERVKNKEKKTECLKNYIGIVNDFIKNEEDKLSMPESCNWDDEAWRKEIKDTINSALSKVIPVNSLGNMCLLNASVNRSYGNDFYTEKRIDIMQKAQDYYIRPHVYDAFNKSFIKRSDGELDTNAMIRWDKSDIMARREEIINKIFKFFGEQK